jgi:uncharacterized repeat protein (TIGR03803 family)
MRWTSFIYTVGPLALVRHEEPAAAPTKLLVGVAAPRYVTASHAIVVVLAAALLHSILCASAQAQPIPSFQSLYSFTNGAEGGSPYANLILSGTTLYGTASGAGTNGSGTVFAISTDGTGFRTLYTFSELIRVPDDPSAAPTNIDGANPAAGLVLSSNILYGTAAYGGTNGYGTLFAVNTDGTGFRLLHTFDFSDGSLPFGALTLSGNRAYGTTVSGGTNGAGTIFAITLPSIPVIDANSMAVSGGQLQFVVGGLTPGATVYVQASSDLSSAANWVPVATNLTTGTNLAISGLSVTNANHRFFRVLETSPP